MATKQRSKQKKSNGHKWQAGPDDAIKLAALRWYAMMIESIAIQIYATDSSKALVVEGILRDCLTKMNGVRPKPITGDDGECPPGFVMCRNECAPMCMNPD